MKYFVNEEYCENFACTLDIFKDIMLDENLKEIKLEEQKRDIGGEMWCSLKDLFVKKWDCGRLCNIYNPCNGKNGRCRHLKNGFIKTGRKFLLTKFRLKEVNNEP